MPTGGSLTDGSSFYRSTNYLDVDVFGASHLRGEIEAGDARFDVSGASEVTLRGSAGDVIVDARDASTIDRPIFLWLMPTSRLAAPARCP
jgi:hypothetical protein